MFFSKQLVSGVVERAVKTFVQSWLAVFGVALGADFVIKDAGEFAALPWESATLTAAVATLLSVAMSLGDRPFTAGQDSAGGAPGGLGDNAVVADDDQLADGQYGDGQYGDDQFGDGSLDEDELNVDEVLAALPADSSDGASRYPTGTE